MGGAGGEGGREGCGAAEKGRGGRVGNKPRKAGAGEKVAPWVWSMQSVVMGWYITAGYESAEAAELRVRVGDWDSEWSLRHMIQVLRQAILDATINPNSAKKAELREMTKTLK